MTDGAPPLAPALPQLRGCALFRDFSDDELRRVVPLLVERTVAPGTRLVEEGDPATELFIVRDGLVEVTKRAPGTSNDHRLTTLGAGTTFGELTLIDRGPRSASVRAVEPTTVAVLRMQDLDGATERDPTLRARMLRNLSLYLAGRLRGVSEVTVTALENELALARTRVAMGTFLTYVIFMMVAYSFGLRLVSDLVKTSADTTLVSIPMILGFAVPLYLMMRRSGEPIATYGLTWQGAGAGARDGVVWSLPVLAAATLLKLGVVRTVPTLAAVPVFSLGGFLDPQVASATAWFTLVMSVAYAGVVPIQEFVARGALQSSLQRFLVGPRATFLAVAIANALFVASHLYLSATFALIAMVPGFLWGALYARHGTLVAPIVSHALIGWWALFVLGFDRLLV
jgi:CRP-like cAMP-binding protein